MTGDDPDDFPVGRCTSCPYPEPHRHGPACDGTCVCRGVGAETAPLPAGHQISCDWGGCDRPSVALRLWRQAGHWLPVCSWHAGWDDFQYFEGVTG